MSGQTPDRTPQELRALRAQLARLAALWDNRGPGNYDYAGELLDVAGITPTGRPKQEPEPDLSPEARQRVRDALAAADPVRGKVSGNS